MKYSAVFILLLFFACKSAKNTVDYSTQGYVKAKVIKWEVENCGYVIELSEDSRIMPQNLPAEFKKDGLLVWVKYELLKKQPNTTCMSGKVANIIDIKKQ